MKKAKLLSLFQRDPKKVKKAKLPENVYYSPANDMSPLWQYVGLALRTLVLYLGVFGITVFICSAAGLTYSDYWQAKVVTPGTVALLCLPVAIACGIASLGKIWALATPIVYVGAFIGYAAINYTDPIAFTVRSVLRVYNYALYNVSGVYTNLQSFMYVTDGYDYQSAEYDLNDPYRFAGVFILASIIGLILYFSVQRKTRLWPVVILLTAVFTPILTYNIAYGNSGISFILVFVCALLGLKVYDYRYGGRAESVAERKKRKAEKKSLRIEKRKKKRKEKLALREEADRVFDKAIDADIPLGKARQARRAVFRSHRDNIKKEKLEKKALARTEKKNAKRARKLKKKRVAELKKKLSASPKGSTSHQAVLAEIAAERADDLEAKANRKAKIQKKRLEKKDLDTARRKASMAGGYAGIGVALIAFLAICLPLSLAKGPFREIPVINDRVRTARAYVTAYLRGSDVDLNDPYVYGLNPLVPRALSYDPLELTDDVIFRVDAEGKSNVYLRSWIATGYNWDENLWQSATFDDIYKYRETMEKGFTPDSIKTAFYSYVYPSSTIIEDENTYKNFTKFGFTVQQVDVWRVRGSGLLLFIPAHMNTDVGLLDYGKMSPAPYKHQSYYEGVYSSLFYRYGRGYGTVSYITAYNRADSAESIERSLLYYNMCADAILAAPDAVGDEAGAIVYSLEQYFSENGIEYLGASSIADRYYFSMTDDEKKAFINSVKAERSYRDFVYETYTQKAENEAISLIAGEIKDAALSAEAENGGDSVLSPHEAVLSVIDYFKTNDFTYTETPNGTLAKGNKPVIESFLTDVKQGYCSHFASSAVFLLREMGFAVRYVEGYVATDFETMGLEGSKTRSDVEGTDAHAWIEVYVEGMGWMQYEVTPGQLADDMYDPNSDTIDPALTEPWEDQGSVEDDENVTPPDFVDDEEEEQLEESLQNRPHTSDEEQVEEDVSDLVLLFRIIVILLIALAVGLIVFLIIKLIRKRAWEAMNARYKVIDSAKNRDTFLEKDFDRHECANKLTDWIMEVFALIGCEPRQGELPSEFVLRMREDYGDLSKVDIEDVIYAIQKEEFGHGLKFDEQNALAEYLEDIISSVYAGMNPWQKLINRYFRRKI